MFNLAFELQKERNGHLKSISILIMFFLLSFWGLEQINIIPQKGGIVLHLTLELLPIFVFSSIVLLEFQRLDGRYIEQSNIIIFGFSIIVIMDYMNAISFSGMPAFISESSSQKSIFFSILARTFELITFAAIALSILLPGTKLLWLCSGGIVSLVLMSCGNLYESYLPLFFIEGKGVTNTKEVIEYFLLVGYVIVAMLFYGKYSNEGKRRYFYFTLSSMCMALFSLLVTHYQSLSDSYLVIAHLIKLVSALLIYKSIFIEGVSYPYFLAGQSEAYASKKKQELNNILDNMGIGVLRLSIDFKLSYFNKNALDTYYYLDKTSRDQRIQDIFPQDIVDKVMPYLIKVCQGEQIRFSLNHLAFDGSQLYRNIIAIPEKNSAGEVLSLLCLIEDITEVKLAEKENEELNRSRAELKKALDQHAIVATTDSQGVITCVNEKFCNISQYSKAELIGKTHSLVNSGTHPPSFFKGMWKTIRSGQVWSGEVCNRAKDGSLYWVNSTIVPFMGDNNKPQKYIAIRADITDRKLAEQNVHRLAMYDELTNLPNRRHLKDKAKSLKLKASEQYYALLLIDLDNFKMVNDTLGHGVGDLLLKEVSRRLEGIVFSPNLVARLGGDEFVILLDEPKYASDSDFLLIDTFAQNVRSVISQSFFLDGFEVNTTPSIGVTIFKNHDFDLSEALKEADIAMYHSKEKGKNTVSFYDPKLQASILELNEITQGLLNAIPRNELKVLYQPIHDTEESLVGYEALLRWDSSLLGSISPDIFIPVAEESKQINRIGLWVLEQVCKDMRDGKIQGNSSVAVNVSSLQFQDPQFVEQVFEVIGRYLISPSRLKLELTEGVILMGTERLIKRMNKLRAIGIKLSLDDFGTGYSSLSYLTRFPIDTLKIDKSFIDKMLTSIEDASVVKAILTLADGLGKNVIAEGVETEEQFIYLKNSGCQYFQGYLFGKPILLN